MTDSNQPSKVVARLFKNGRSQAVRLPKSMQLDSAEVWVWKEGDRVILEPIPRRSWPTGYWERLEALSSDLAVDIEEIAPKFMDISLD